MAKLTETATCGTTCPLRRTLAVIEGKYTPLILKELFDGTRRFGELRRQIQGISPKTLSEKLKDLIQQGVVERISYPEVPPKVEYRLTPRGARMKGIIQQLQEFWQEETELPPPAIQLPQIDNLERLVQHHGTRLQIERMHLLPKMKRARES